MKSKLRWLLLIIPLALFAWAYQAASWRPKLVGAYPGPPLQGILVAPATFSGPKLLVSPDGKYLVSRDERFTGDSLIAWALPSNRQLWVKGGRRQAPFAFSPDSQTLAVVEDKSVFGRPNAAISLVESATGKSRALRQSFWQTDLQSAAFLSNRELVAATSRGAIVVDTQTGKVIRQWKFESPAFQNTKLPFRNQSHVSADGKTILALASATYNTDVALYDVVTGKRRATWNYQNVFRNPRLSADGTLWAMIQSDVDYPRFYDARTGQNFSRTLPHGDANAFQYWKDDGSVIASSVNGRLAFLNTRNGRDLWDVPFDRNASIFISDSPGDYFYILDKSGKIWRRRAR